MLSFILISLRIHLMEKIKLNSSFLAGLLIGTLAVGGIFLLNDLTSNKEKITKSNRLAKNHDQKSKSKPVIQYNEMTSTGNKTKTGKNTDNAEKRIEVTTVGDDITVDTMTIDSLDMSELKDSVPNNILVRKDVLMRTLSFKFEVAKDTSTLIDSLEKSLDIDKVNHETYYVELWESPLGFSGYKTSGNRIMVFGLDSVATFDLKLEDGYKVLKANKTRYRIMNEADFRPLSKISTK